MVKFFESSFSYDYSFPAVTLAYFLRYPNPFSKHVLSTDVVDRYFDPATQRLHSVRLHLKRSKIPSAVLKILPKSVLGATSGNAGQSYILEKTVVDVQEGWMKTETKNLEWTGILSVIEKQHYTRRTDEPRSVDGSRGSPVPDSMVDGGTDVRTIVSFQSRFGQGRLLGGKHGKTASATSSQDEDEVVPKKGFFASLSASGIQRSIEIIGVRRTGDHFFKSTEGMKLVLERLRKGGLVSVLEGMKKDRESAFAGREGPWMRKRGGGVDGADYGVEGEKAMDRLMDDE